MVLNALCADCYEPLESADISLLSHKLALLLALTSAGRVSELCALSVKDLVFAAGNDAGWCCLNRSDCLARCRKCKSFLCVESWCSLPSCRFS